MAIWNVLGTVKPACNEHNWECVHCSQVTIMDNANESFKTFKSVPYRQVFVIDRWLLRQVLLYEWLMVGWLWQLVIIVMWHIFIFLMHNECTKLYCIYAQSVVMQVTIGCHSTSLEVCHSCRPYPKCSCQLWPGRLTINGPHAYLRIL